MLDNFGKELSLPLRAIIGKNWRDWLGQTPWTETILGSFSGGSDGDLPQAGLFARKDRTSQSTIYYGTTSGLEVGLGTVFKLTGQTLTPIWNFTGGSDGSSPQAGLITDERGVLYGTSGGGGASNKGVVFQLTPPNHGQTAWSEQTLWSFSGATSCTASPP
ncbi:MAG TPA: choice-of-anchor tandem repeat GloVer-containing protein [Methylocella sp.]